MATLYEVSIHELAKILKEKNFPKAREWVNSNLDNEPHILFRTIYDSFYKTMIPTSIPAAILILAKYQSWAEIVPDQEINTLACLTEIMVECTFK